MRYTLASLALAYLVVMSPTNSELQTGMIPVVDTKPTGFNPCLISGWPMNEGTSVTLRDVSGNSNTATITGGGIVWQSNAGLPGITALWDGGTRANSASTTLTNFTGTTPFSVSFWANPTSNGTYFSTLDTSGVDKGWEVAQATGSTLEFFIVNTFPGNRLDVTATLNINTGLHYVVVTSANGTAAGVKVYIDGTSQTVTTVANTLSATAANGLPVTFGERKDTSLGLHGAMAFVGVYNCVLTSTQVSTNFAGGPAIN